MSDVRVRFAPSPTGYLHIGGVRTALFNWLWARKTGGKFVLRIEDTDQERSTPESTAIILESLRWLGLTWDEGPEAGGDHGPYVQTERLVLYKQYSERLIASGRAYRCVCTKADLDAQREALKARDPKANFRYPGTCRDKGHGAHEPHVVRFTVPRDGAVVYTDKVFGEVRTPNGAQQDFVILRGDGVPLYNFGAVVDDLTMGITLVARGRDHMVNTPPQILLYEALDAPVPSFAHLPMMLAPSGEKLSKRHGAVSVTEYREKGYTPEGVLNYLVRFGWSCGDREIFSMDELVEAFTWETCGRGDGKFDAKKFLAVNHEHMKLERLQTASTYASRAKPFLLARSLPLPSSEATLDAALKTVRDRSRTFVEAAEAVDFYFRTEPAVDEVAAAKFLVAPVAERMGGFAGALAAANEWAEKPLEEAVHAWLMRENLQIKDVAQACRVALTGRSASPGLFEVLAVLGRSVSLARLEAGRIRAAAALGASP